MACSATGGPKIFEKVELLAPEIRGLKVLNGIFEIVCYRVGTFIMNCLAAHLDTPFENAQRCMGQNTFPILPLNDYNMLGEH